MNQERLLFDTIKVDRGDYFVEYQPPIAATPFATVLLIFPNATAANDIAAAMETELSRWLSRYAVPVMVSSFDGAGDLISLDGVRDTNHVIGWREQGTSTPQMFWRLVRDDEFPRRSWPPSELRAIYADVPFKTSSDLAIAAKGHRRVVRTGWWLVFLWLVAVPAAIAVIEYNAPAWLAFLGFIYSLTRAYIAFLKLRGEWPKTPGDVAKEEEERRMRHHHYHCERNPEAFERLKRENLERQSREEIHQEAARLKGAGSSGEGERKG